MHVAGRCQHVYDVLCADGQGGRVGVLQQRGEATDCHMIEVQHRLVIIVILGPAQQLGAEEVAAAYQHHFVGKEELVLHTDGHVTQVAISTQRVKLYQHLLAVRGGAVSESFCPHVGAGL